MNDQSLSRRSDGFFERGLGILMLALRWHAWRCRVQIQLDPLECLLTRRHMLRSAMLPLFALLSLLLTLPLDRHSPGWALALPGFVYFGLFAQFLAMRMGRREEQSLRADAALVGRE